MKLQFLLVGLFFVIGAAVNLGAHGGNYAVDLIVFSKDRPLQLYAFLESLTNNAKGFHDISVLCHAKNERIARAYDEVQQKFPHVDFVFQSRENPRGDFKQLLCSLVDHSHASYIIFAVDDIIVTDSFDIQECAQLLAQTKAYGFYLRLGKEISGCFMERRETGLPHLYPVQGGVGFLWQFDTGTGDWRYPNTVDMTLYPKTTVVQACHGLQYHSPNTFEGVWCGRVNLKASGLCFEKSKMINIPMNLVQTDWKNLATNSFSADQLLELFEKGLKIDVAALHKCPHKSPHVDMVPTFVKRS